MSRELKIEVARAALDFVKPGMKLGIGTGSTADEFIRLLAEKVQGGLEIVGVPTSERSAKLCEALGVPLTSLKQTPELDLTIDGADEVDPGLSLIKGAGGALLREKIVAATSHNMVVIVDESKIVEQLGSIFALPVEVNPFGLEVTQLSIQKAARQLGLSDQLVLRYDGDEIYVTDGGHYIIDASFGRIRDAKALSNALLEIPGVVQHGLFIDLATMVLVASEGGVRQLIR